MTYALAVDPDAARGARTASVLASLGLDAKLVTDGIDALEHLRRHGRPALLVTELVLPRSDGFVLLRRLRLLSGTPTRVIVLSSSRQAREEAERSRAMLGIDALLSGATSAQSLLRVGRLLLGPCASLAPASVPTPRLGTEATRPRSKIEALVLSVATDFGIAAADVAWIPPSDSGGADGLRAAAGHGSGDTFPLLGADGSLLGHLSFSDDAWASSRADSERLAVMIREVVREIENAMPQKRAPRRGDRASLETASLGQE